MGMGEMEKQELQIAILIYDITLFINLECEGFEVEKLNHCTNSNPLNNIENLFIKDLILMQCLYQSFIFFFNLLSRFF
jgi:hypothetical protein